MPQHALARRGGQIIAYFWNLRQGDRIIRQSCRTDLVAPFAVLPAERPDLVCSTGWKP